MRLFQASAGLQAPRVCTNVSDKGLTHPVVDGAERPLEADRSRVGGARSQCWCSKDDESRSQGEDELGHGGVGFSTGWRAVRFMGQASGNAL